MWRDWKDERALPCGVIRVDKVRKKLIFGAATLKGWQLAKFRSVSLKVNDSKGLAGFQFHLDDEGNRVFSPSGSGSTSSINCQAFLRFVGARPNACYKAHRELDGFVTIDFERGIISADKKNNGSSQSSENGNANLDAILAAATQNRAPS